MTHPDEMMQMLASLAKQHGYGITDIEFVGRRLVGGSLPRHIYSCQPLVVDGMDGSQVVFPDPPTAKG